MAEWTFEEGEYVIIIERLALPEGVGICREIIFLDVYPECSDADNDFICNFNDCDDNDPNVSVKFSPGTGCNDDNPNTENDVIQEDGCSCAGTPIIENSCDNISLSLNTNNNRVIDVNGKFGGKEIVKVYDAHWNIVRDCASIPDYEGECTNFGPFEPGLYRVYVQQYTDDWQYICETDFLEIEVPDPTSAGRNQPDLLNEKDIQLFPNPVLHTLNIRTKVLQDKKGSIQIFNTFGQLIETIPEKTFTQSIESIDVGHYQNGLYLMTIKVDNRRVISKRFLVENLK